MDRRVRQRGGGQARRAQVHPGALDPGVTVSSSPLTLRCVCTKINVVRSAYLTKRGHIDLLRVASAACRPCR
ncbi:putative leader peptide [Micromonospora gifhornensis]|uniref:putative leader peptide n=1 Tax=Micromonospora gifhornensis TaxID=84594 RepID=UPI003D72E56E